MSCCVPYNIISRGQGASPLLRPFIARAIGVAPIIPLVTIISPGNIIDWGDGSTPFTAPAGPQQSNYLLPGIYNIKIYGSNDITITGAGLGQVIQWGDYPVNHVQFYYDTVIDVTSTLLTAVPNQIPPTMTSTANMFAGTVIFNQDLSSWDVSNVTDMSGMFSSALLVNQDLSGWCVSGVTNHTNFDAGTLLWLLPKPNFASPPC